MGNHGTVVEIEDLDVFEAGVVDGRLVLLTDQEQDYFELTRKDVVRMVKAMGITKAELIVAGIT